MKSILKKIFTFLTIFTFAFSLTACNMEELLENLQQGIPNIGGGNVEQTPDEPVVQPTPETPEPETQTPITPEDMSKTGLYVRGSMNEWSVHEKYELKYNWDGSGYPTITLNLFKNDEFKVADINWEVNYGYNDEITLDFMDSFGNIKVVNDGLYLIQIIDDKIVIKQSAGNGYFNTNLDYGMTIWTDPTMCFKDQDNSWNVNGNGLFISVDSQGRIAYMVYKPKDGYGMPNTNTYARHSIYNDYRDNPTFSEVYFDYNEDIKYRLVTPTDGFVITANGDSAYDILTRSMFGRYILGDECLTFNNSRFDVNSLRITYDELGNIYCTKVVDDTPNHSPISIADQIQAEYDLLKEGSTKEHTTWTVTGTIVDMQATSYDTSRGYYLVSFIMNVDGLLIGVYNGRVNNSYPKDIRGLEVGTEVTIIGIIAEKYDLTSGDYYAQIEFSGPEISWEYDSLTNDLYIRGSMNDWNAFDDYKLNYINGAQSIALYLEAGQEFKIANMYWSIEYSYNESLYPDIVEQNGNMAAMISGYYEFTVSDGVLSYQKITASGKLETDVIEDGVGIWTTSGEVIKNHDNTWITANGWRLYIAVDYKGRIAYLVINPVNGYGDPMGNNYLRHSMYYNYRTNPAFANVSDEYEGKWGPTVDYEFVVPKDGFVITVADEELKRELLFRILGEYKSYYEDYYVNNNVTHNVDNIRISYNSNGSVFVEYLEDDYDSSKLIIEEYAYKNNWENGTQYKEIYFDEYTVISSEGLEDNPKVLTGKWYTSDSSWRLYQHVQTTITFNSSKEISYICVEYISQKDGVLVYGDSQYESLDVIEVNANTITLSVGNKTEMTNGQVRITAITIKYAE